MVETERMDFIGFPLWRYDANIDERARRPDHDGPDRRNLRDDGDAVNVADRNSEPECDENLSRLDQQGEKSIKSGRQAFTFA